MMRIDVTYDLFVILPGSAISQGADQMVHTEITEDVKPCRGSFNNMYLTYSLVTTWIVFDFWRSVFTEITLD